MSSLIKYKKMCHNHKICNGWIYENKNGKYCRECRIKNNLLKEN
jgi:hypothetical protein